VKLPEDVTYKEFTRLANLTATHLRNDVTAGRAAADVTKDTCTTKARCVALNVCNCWALCLDSSERVCSYCKEPLDLLNVSLDRKDNLSDHSLCNIIFSCKRCNTWKNVGASPQEFAAFHAFLQWARGGIRGGVAGLRSVVSALDTQVPTVLEVMEKKATHVSDESTPGVQARVRCRNNNKSEGKSTKKNSKRATSRQ